MGLTQKIHNGDVKYIEPTFGKPHGRR